MGKKRQKATELIKSPSSTSTSAPRANGAAAAAGVSTAPRPRAKPRPVLFLHPFVGVSLQEPPSAAYPASLASASDEDIVPSAPNAPPGRMVVRLGSDRAACRQSLAAAGLGQPAARGGDNSNRDIYSCMVVTYEKQSRSSGNKCWTVVGVELVYPADVRLLGRDCAHHLEREEERQGEREMAGSGSGGSSGNAVTAAASSGPAGADWHIDDMLVQSVDELTERFRRVDSALTLSEGFESARLAITAWDPLDGDDEEEDGDHRENEQALPDEYGHVLRKTGPLRSMECVGVWTKPQSIAASSAPAARLPSAEDATRLIPADSSKQQQRPIPVPLLLNAAPRTWPALQPHALRRTGRVYAVIAASCGAGMYSKESLGKRAFVSKRLLVFIEYRGNQQFIQQLRSAFVQLNSRTPVSPLQASFLTHPNTEKKTGQEEKEEENENDKCQDGGGGTASGELVLVPEEQVTPYVNAALDEHFEDDDDADDDTDAGALSVERKLLAALQRHGITLPLPPAWQPQPQQQQQPTPPTASNNRSKKRACLAAADVQTQTALTMKVDVQIAEKIVGQVALFDSRLLANAHVLYILLLESGLQWYTRRWEDMEEEDGDEDVGDIYHDDNDFEYERRQVELE